MGNKVFNILIVEDQSADVLAPYMLMCQLGHNVILAFDGEQALSEIARNRVDLIILDWNMPVLSGEEFLSSLERRNGVPVQDIAKIVIHSGQSLGIESFRNAVNFQVLDIWKKPLSPLEILKKVKRIHEAIAG